MSVRNQQTCRTKVKIALPFLFHHIYMFLLLFARRETGCGKPGWGWGCDRFFKVTQNGVCSLWFHVLFLFLKNSQYLSAEYSHRSFADLPPNFHKCVSFRQIVSQPRSHCHAGFVSIAEPPGCSVTQNMDITVKITQRIAVRAHILLPKRTLGNVSLPDKFPKWFHHEFLTF